MKTKNKHRAIVAGLAISLLVVPIAARSATKQQGQPQRLEELLKAKQATLQQLVELVTVEYRNGVTGFDAVVRATDQLLDAELALAKEANARVTILKKRVKLMKSLLAMVEARFEAAQVSRSQVLAAKAAMLDSLIRLTREQARKPKQ